MSMADARCPPAAAYSTTASISAKSACYFPAGEKSSVISAMLIGP